MDRNTKQPFPLLCMPPPPREPWCSKALGTSYESFLTIPQSARPGAQGLMETTHKLHSFAKVDNSLQTAPPSPPIPIAFLLGEMQLACPFSDRGVKE